MTPPKLIVDDQGRVHGTNVTWNNPFPCPNGDDNKMEVPKGVFGLIMHTQVGNNPKSIELFNDPTYQASAHFCIAQNGAIVQMGAINGWKAWAQGHGNTNYYSAEFADNGDPTNKLTEQQLDSGAQLLELLSRPTVGRFPMQIADTPGAEGFGWHGMGGKAWCNHPHCPGDIRKAQRPEIIKRAEAVRTGGELAVYPCKGQKSLDGLAKQLHSAPSTLLRLTAEHSPGRKFYSGIAGYLNEVFAADTVKVPKDTNVYYPDPANHQMPKLSRSHGDQTLQGLALTFGCKPADIVQCTAENSPGAVFPAAMAKYLNDVFRNSTIHVPNGAHLFYQK